MTVPVIPPEQTMADFARSRGTPMYFVISTLPDGGLLFEAHDATLGDNTPDNPARGLLFGARLEVDNAETILEKLIYATSTRARQAFVIEAVRPTLVRPTAEPPTDAPPSEEAA